jgi:hypothetical protein
MMPDGWLAFLALFLLGGACVTWMAAFSPNTDPPPVPPAAPPAPRLFWVMSALLWVNGVLLATLLTGWLWRWPPGWG